MTLRLKLRFIACAMFTACPILGIVLGLTLNAPADDAAFVEVYSEPAPEVGLTHPEVQNTLDAVALEPVPDTISTDPCNCKPTCQCTANQCTAQGCNPATQTQPKKAASQPQACANGRCYVPVRRGLFGIFRR